MRIVITVMALCCFIAMMLNGCTSTYVTSAKVYIQEGYNDKAKEQLTNGLKQNPGDAQAHYILGTLYAQDKDYEEMITEFDATQALTKKYDDDIHALKDKHFDNQYNASVEHFNNKRIEQAIKTMKIAVLIDPTDQEGWTLLGKSYVRNQEYDKAIDVIQKAIELDPNFENIEDRVLLMDVYYNTKKYDEALNCAMEILRVDETNKDAVRKAAFCYNELGQSEKAMQYYRELLKNNPDDSDLIYNFGLLYEKRENYQEAVTQFVRAIEINPTDNEAILHCAQLYMELLQDNDNAVKYFRMAVEIDPENSGVLNNLGVALIRAGNEKDDAKLIEEGTALIKKANELKGLNQ